MATLAIGRIVAGMVTQQTSRGEPGADRADRDLLAPTKRADPGIRAERIVECESEHAVLFVAAWLASVHGPLSLFFRPAAGFAQCSRSAAASQDAPTK